MNTKKTPHQQKKKTTILTIDETQKEIFLERLRVELLERFGPIRFMRERSTTTTTITRTITGKGRRRKPDRSDESDDARPAAVVAGAGPLEYHVARKKNFPAADRAELLLLRDRIVMGTNACTKLLLHESVAALAPPIRRSTTMIHDDDDNCLPSLLLLLLVICADADEAVVGHLYASAKQKMVPTIVLPMASWELGKVLGVRRVSVLALQRRQRSLSLSPSSDPVDKDVLVVGTTTTSEEEEAEKRVDQAISSFVDMVSTYIAHPETTTWTAVPPPP
jgi:ribosomal protein L7Ae-like RNA K-turn-binding protein